MLQKALYHLTCWILKQCEAKLECNTNPQEIDDISQVISAIEIINIIENKLIFPSDAILNMNNINLMSQNLLSSNGHTEIKSNYKRYLKQLIIESIDGVRKEILKLT